MRTARPDAYRAFNSWRLFGRVLARPRKEFAADGSVLCRIVVRAKCVGQGEFEAVCSGSAADAAATMLRRNDLVSLWGMLAPGPEGVVLRCLEWSMLETDAPSADPERDYLSVVGLYSPESIDGRRGSDGSGE